MSSFIKISTAAFKKGIHQVILSKFWATYTFSYALQYVTPLCWHSEHVRKIQAARLAGHCTTLSWYTYGLGSVPWLNNNDIMSRSILTLLTILMTPLYFRRWRFKAVGDRVWKLPFRRCSLLPLSSQAGSQGWGRCWRRGRWHCTVSQLSSCLPSCQCWVVGHLLLLPTSPGQRLASNKRIVIGGHTMFI